MNRPTPSSQLWPFTSLGASFALATLRPEIFDAIESVDVLAKLGVGWGWGWEVATLCLSLFSSMLMEMICSCLSVYVLCAHMFVCMCVCVLGVVTHTLYMWKPELTLDIFLWNHLPCSLR